MRDPSDDDARSGTGERAGASAATLAAMDKPKALERALVHAQAWLDGLETRSVAATASLATLRDRIGRPLGDTGVPAVRVIDDLVASTEGGHLGSAGGRFFAWVIGGSLESALAADWLTSTWEQNAALYACGPAVSVIEEVAGAWVKELLDLPREASFAFTTGCQLAHVTCLAAARHRVLAKVGWDVEAEGLAGAPRVRILTTAERHSSVDRAVRFLGFGTRSMQPIATDADGRIRADALEAALTSSTGPVIVVLDAADLNIGAFDGFATIIPLAKKYGAWVHVDGAFGLFARASRTQRAQIEGVELADSWATDAHKWLNVPYDCGIAVVKDVEAHRAAMTVSASYIAPAAGRARDQIDWNPDFSRRARGVTVYAALRELGRTGVEDLIDRTCRYCADIVAGIGTVPGAEVLWQPTLNQGLVRFLDPRTGATEADHDARTVATIEAINATGEAFFSGTVWRGRQAMRISVVNWRTTDADVTRVVAAVRSVLAR
jgi:glutamate/tyrosine decarboxylase-like PLP-dependent enzyme